MYLNETHFFDSIILSERFISIILYLTGIMGQSESLNALPDAVESIQDSIIRQAKNLSEISSLSYEEFLDNLSELNTLYEIDVWCGFTMYLLYITFRIPDPDDVWMRKASSWFS